jgi:thimet oligopeptidase
MPHDQVETLFHEFGHVMHENLSRARFFSQAGTIVARDFVEAPSQMLENWVWSEEVLARLSRHYKTGDALPQELIRKMLSAKRHMESYFNMRQMALALFDFRLHTEDHASGIVELYNGIVAELLGVGLLPEHRWPAGFGHLAGGYDAGYYGYMWSKVYACDMFTRFESEGVLNAATGMDYRRKILEVGSSRDELESVKDFLGREPNNKAFLIELGLAE